MRAKARVIKSKYFWYGESGPHLIRWLTFKDLLLPKASRGDEPATICGAEYYLDMDTTAWIVFFNMEVIQIVPDRTHSYWHLKCGVDTETASGLWLIEDSEWKQTFDLNYLADKKHFIVTFQYDVVEVFCEDLILGEGKFNARFLANNDHRFAEEYIYRANTYLRKDMYEKAIKDFNHYLLLQPNGRCAERAKENIRLLKTKKESSTKN